MTFSTEKVIIYFEYDTVHRHSIRSVMKRFIGAVVVAVLILTVAAMTASCQNNSNYPDYKLNPDYTPTTIPVTETETETETEEETTVPEETTAPETGNAHVDFFGGTADTDDKALPTDTNGNVDTWGEEEGWSSGWV